MQISGADPVTELENTDLILRHVQETDDFLKGWMQFLPLVLKPVLIIYSTLSKEMGAMYRKMRFDKAFL